MSALKYRRLGFSVVELLVVIGIAILLFAITIPIGKNLRESNSAMGCEAQLQHIGTALRTYFMDEGGVPPIAVAVDSSGVPEADAEIDFDYWPGLLVLHEMGYMGTAESFHCPRDVYAEAGSDEYFLSYVDKDENAKVDYGGSDINVNQYKYMPHRWAPDESVVGSDFHRQLDTAPSDIFAFDGDDVRVAGPCGGSMPPDSTIVTWCDAHFDSYTKDGHGQYMVLFWDGTVQPMDGALFRDAGVEPEAAWQVAPDDVAH
jgi:competence protein ComGC